MTQMDDTSLNCVTRRSALRSCDALSVNLSYISLRGDALGWEKTTRHYARMPTIPFHLVASSLTFRQTPCSLVADSFCIKGNKSSFLKSYLQFLVS